MKRKICFMFISPACKEKPMRTVMDLGQGEMIVIGVGSYDMACEKAVELAKEGVILIELCGGFGTMGHAKVTEALKDVESPAGKVWVGVVRFDNHPGYDNQSGDSKWMA